MLDIAWPAWRMAVILQRRESIKASIINAKKYHTLNIYNIWLKKY